MGAAEAAVVLVEVAMAAVVTVEELPQVAVTAVVMVAGMAAATVDRQGATLVGCVPPLQSPGLARLLLLVASAVQVGLAESEV